METALARGKALELIEARLGQFQPGTRYLLGKSMNLVCSGRIAGWYPGPSQVVCAESAPKCAGKSGRHRHAYHGSGGVCSSDDRAGVGRQVYRFRRITGRCVMPSALFARGMYHTSPEKLAQLAP
jgi:hypothetical protein